MPWGRATKPMTMAFEGLEWETDKVCRPFVLRPYTHTHALLTTHLYLPLSLFRSLPSAPSFPSPRALLYSLPTLAYCLPPANHTASTDFTHRESKCCITAAVSYTPDRFSPLWVRDTRPAGSVGNEWPTTSLGKTLQPSSPRPPTPSPSTPPIPAPHDYVSIRPQRRRKDDACQCAGRAHAGQPRRGGAEWQPAEQEATPKYCLRDAERHSSHKPHCQGMREG